MLPFTMTSVSQIEKRPRVVVVGSANMDMVARVPHLPRPGETILGGEFAMLPGGKGANQAVAVGKIRRIGDVCRLCRRGHVR